MLWRQGYATQTFRNVRWPLDASLRLAIGLFEPGGLKELTIWHRMIVAELGLAPAVLFVCPSEGAETLRSALPPSIGRDGRVIGEVAWPDMDDHRGRAFAAVVNESACSVLMVGPPTEGAWDEFAQAYRSL